MFCQHVIVDEAGGKRSHTAMTDTLRVEEGNGACNLTAHAMPCGRGQSSADPGRAEPWAQESKDKAAVGSVDSRDGERIFEGDDAWVA